MKYETRYAKSDGLSIAYQVAGHGDIDLVFVMGWVSNIDVLWEGPGAGFLERLASFSRLIVFDKRGTGLSDRVSELPTIEQRMDDVRAVMDAAGSRRAAPLGISEGAAMCACFAATYPERTTALAMYGAYAKRIWDPEYPWAPTRPERQRFFTAIEQGWGGVVDLDLLAPSAADDPAFREWWATYLQQSASPGAALALARMNTEIDIRHVLPAIRVPVLIVHRTGDLDIDVRGARHMAGQIPNARYVELPGTDHLVFAGDRDAVLDEIERFLTGTITSPIPDRVLATLLFFELVGALAIAVKVGDAAWASMQGRFEAELATLTATYRGRILNRNAMGYAVAFDGPARAVRCAAEISRHAVSMGIRTRAGLHSGECELTASQPAGVAAQIAARVMGRASAGEIVASRTVFDLVAGSGLTFAPLTSPLVIGENHSIDLFRVLEPGAVPDSTTVDTERIRDGATLLSPREREVAARIGRGYTNRMIAGELSISVATVERHAANIFNKLGVRSRSQVAVWALDSGLLDTSES